MKYIKIRPEHFKIVDTYLNVLERDVNPALDAAEDRMEWRKALELRYKATDLFWEQITKVYPEIKDMACGLATTKDDPPVHVIVVQGKMETIQRDLRDGKAQSLLVEGSQTWEQLERGRRKGFI